MADYPVPFCFPNLACLLTCFGCGCIPLASLINKTAPIDCCGILTISKGCALPFAILFWLCSIEAIKQGTVILGLSFAIFCVAVKQKLGVQDDDMMVFIKGFLCGPCMIGQLAGTAATYAREDYEPLEDPVAVV
mmetsp:Transcript_84024/g.153826  ORF Transcript_84024/g.153826 Transcript_84024/m.153826 type:complete len:134 (-) Transcript_84024:226-627(-)